MAKVSEGLKGYFAGLLDGEGTPFISKIRGKYQASYEYRGVVSITNTIRQPLDLLQQYYGGTVYPMRKGNNKGPTGKPGKTLYEWKVLCRKAYLFLQDVLPFLIIKREAALLVVELQERMQYSGGGVKLRDDEIQAREQLCQKIRELKGGHK